MKRRTAAALAAVLIGTQCLSGCESMLEREYVVTSVHAEATTTEQNPSGVRVESIDEAMELLQGAVHEGETDLAVQIAYHGDDLDSALKEAIADYQKDPVCAYAVQLITYRLTKILTYHEIRFNISYRRTPEQIAAVRTIQNVAVFREEIEAQLRDFSKTRAYLIENYRQEDYNLSEIVESIYESTPSVAYGMTDVSCTLTPESGKNRVMEVVISYDSASQTLVTKSRAATSSAHIILSTTQQEGDGLFLELHDALCRFARYDEDTEETHSRTVYTDPYTAYGALAQNRAVSTGYAMAYKLICDEAGLECMVVHGRLGSEDHAWNLVQLGDGYWYHVDVALDDEEQETGYRFFGLTDEEMRLTHQWDETKYPACTGRHGRDVLPDDENLLTHSRYDDSSLWSSVRQEMGIDIENTDLPPDEPEGETQGNFAEDGSKYE